MTEQLHFHLSLSCIGGGNGTPLQCSCLETPRDGGAWWAAVCGVAQSRTRLERRSSSSSSGGWEGKESARNAGGRSVIPGSGRSPGEGMAAHSNTLAWRTPWREEPAGLLSMRSQTVGHDLATEQQQQQLLLRLTQYHCSPRKSTWECEIMCELQTRNQRETEWSQGPWVASLLQLLNMLPSLPGLCSY